MNNYNYGLCLNDFWQRGREHSYKYKSLPLAQPPAFFIIFSLTSFLPLFPSCSCMYKYIYTIYTTIQMFWMKLFILFKNALNWSKDMYNVKKMSASNKCSSELFIC